MGKKKSTLAKKIINAAGVVAIAASVAGGVQCSREIPQEHKDLYTLFEYFYTEMLHQSLANTPMEIVQRDFEAFLDETELQKIIAKKLGMEIHQTQTEDKGNNK
jgi:hypothetical protein